MLFGVIVPFVVQINFIKLTEGGILGGKEAISLPLCPLKSQCFAPPKAAQNTDARPS